MNNPDERYMKLALEQAYAAYAAGEVPVGAILVSGDRIVAEGHNLREKNLDPTAHAELLVIQKAAALLNRWRLSSATLYVTLEPCPMCAGALIQARISRLVFGCYDPKAGACGSLINLPEDPRFNHRLRVESGCLEEECSVLLRRFFSGLRESRSASRKSIPA